MSGRRITLSDIARALGLTLPAVSNWRRRHETFPAAASVVDGNESFDVVAVAAWLDTRKVRGPDLQATELPGTTYGARFRKAMGLDPQESASPRPRPVDRDVAGALWKQFDRMRGVASITTSTNILLKLLYIAVVDRASWRQVVHAESVDRAWEVYRVVGMHPDLSADLARAVDGLLGDGNGVRFLSDLVDLVERVRSSEQAVGVFESVVEQVASTLGRQDRGEVHTPPSVVRMLVNAVDPRPGDRVFDPACGTGRLLTGVAEHLTATTGSGLADTSFTGHAFSASFASLARMNLTLYGATAEVDERAARVLDTSFIEVRREYTCVLSNPPYDLKKTSPAGAQWRVHGPYGSLPPNRTNFIWLQHIASSLAAGGRAAVLMPGGTLFRQGAEQGVRAAMVEAGVVESIIALPSKLFPTTSIPVTAWLLTTPSPTPAADREVLLVDATNLGTMTSRTRRVLSDEHQERISDVLRAWRLRDGYGDVPGFAASVSLERIRAQDYVLVPARYVGSSAGAPPTRSVTELLVELDRLDRLAAQADVRAADWLKKVGEWTP